MADKYFIITVDTEGDDLWGKESNALDVSTENARYIEPFQSMCEKYCFPPVYLTNYEMALDSFFVDFAKLKNQENKCEVGIHVHAWNTPPFYELRGRFNKNSYLIEYPYDIMEAKFASTYNVIKENIGTTPISHRAGRWAMNSQYFSLLNKYKIKVDCSVTPGINWSSSKGIDIGGTDYRKASNQPTIIDNILEVPVTIDRIFHFRGISLKSKIKNLLLGEKAWIRPSLTNLDSIVQLLNKAESRNNTDYIEFMIHSSEFMPGGSPYYKTESDIIRLYSELESLFAFIKKKGYKGIMLKDYYEIHKR